MYPKDAKGAALRKAVAERHRRFSADLTTQLAGGTAEIWSSVERRLAHQSPETEPEGEASPSPERQSAATTEEEQRRQVGRPAHSGRRLCSTRA